jgi:hypothetical protein
MRKALQLGGDIAPTSVSRCRGLAPGGGNRPHTTFASFLTLSRGQVLEARERIGVRLREVRREHVPSERSFLVMGTAPRCCEA